MTGEIKNRLIKIGIALAVLIVLVFLVLLSSSRQEDTRCSIYSRDRTGLMALYETLKSSKFDVNILSGPLDNTIPKGTIFIVNPIISPDKTEISELKKWISSGNTLVCSSAVYAPMFAQAFGEEPRINATKPKITCPLTDGVNSLDISSDERIDSSEWSFDYLLDVQNISGRETAKTPYNADVTDLIKMDPVFADKYGDSVQIGSYGNGRIILISDPSIIANICIGKSDNILFVTNILQTARGASRNCAIFYEYGNQTLRVLPGSGVWSLMTPQVRIGFYIIIVFFVLLVILGAIRFGPVRILGGRARNRGEYLGALSNLLQKGNGNDVVMDELGAKFKEDILKALSLDQNVDIDTIMHIAGNRGLTDTNLLRRLIVEAEKAHNRVSDDSALIVARRWYKMRKEIEKLR